MFGSRMFYYSVYMQLRLLLSDKVISCKIFVIQKYLNDTILHYCTYGAVFENVQ